MSSQILQTRKAKLHGLTFLSRIFPPFFLGRMANASNIFPTIYSGKSSMKLSKSINLPMTFFKFDSIWLDICGGM